MSGHQQGVQRQLFLVLGLGQLCDIGGCTDLGTSCAGNGIKHVVQRALYELLPPQVLPCVGAPGLPLTQIQGNWTCCMSSYHLFGSRPQQHVRCAEKPYPILINRLQPGRTGCCIWAGLSSLPLQLKLTLACE
jgi:hypothetical protein